MSQLYEEAQTFLDSGDTALAIQNLVCCITLHPLKREYSTLLSAAVRRHRAVSESVVINLNKLDLENESTNCDDATKTKDGEESDISIEPLKIHRPKCNLTDFLIPDLLTELKLKIDRIDSQTNRSMVLHTLDLQQNDIGTVGFLALHPLLMESHHLNTLILFDNQLGDKACVELSRLLQNTKTLSTLDINQNGITFTGAIALAHGLANSRSLTKLDVGFNALGDDGVILLASAVRSNALSILRDMRFCGVQCEEAGALALVSLTLSHPFAGVSQCGKNPHFPPEAASSLLKLFTLKQQRYADFSQDELQAAREEFRDALARHVPLFVKPLFKHALQEAPGAPFAPLTPFASYTRDARNDRYDVADGTPAATHDSSAAYVAELQAFATSGVSPPRVPGPLWSLVITLFLSEFFCFCFFPFLFLFFGLLFSSHHVSFPPRRRRHCRSPQSTISHFNNEISP